MELSNGNRRILQVKKQEVTLIRPAKETFNGVFFLSNLDQTFPQGIEVVFAFKKSETMQQEDAIKTLKESIAKALVEFYPFAGCLTTAHDGMMHVRCTGEGVQFVEAVSDNTIEEIGDLSVSDTLNLRELVHYKKDAESIVDVPLFTVQATKLKCGGLIIGTSMNHVLLDGKAASEFLLAWAEIARGLPLSVPPFLDHSIFNARNPLFVDIPHPEYIQRERKKKTIAYNEPLVNGTFCFGPEKVDQLRKMANDDELRTPPTNFEVISALVWILWTKAYKIKPDETTKMLTAVDGRTKFKKTPVPKRFFGNAIAWSCAQCKAGELMEKPFPSVVKIVREAIKKVTEDYIRSAIDYYEMARGGLEFENTFHISKWSALPFYDIDFGFGKPVQVAPASLVDNLILAISQGKGSQNIMVSLSLPESVMESFQDLVQQELKRK